MQTKLPRPMHFGPPSQPLPTASPAPPKRECRWRPRWEWLLIILAILLVAFLLKGARPAFTWDDVMDALHVRNRPRYTQLAELGCVLVALTWIQNVLRHERKD